MAVFMVAPTVTGSPALAAKIESAIPAGNAMQLPGGTWLIAFDGTTKALSDAIGMSNGDPVGGVVVAISAYWGFAGKDIWEFLNVKSK
jgi:hypothetical protein